MCSYKNMHSKCVRIRTNDKYFVYYLQHFKIQIYIIFFIMYQKNYYPEHELKNNFAI